MSRTKRSIFLVGVVLGLLCLVIVGLLLVAVIRALMIKEVDAYVEFKGVQYAIDDTQLEKYVSIFGNAIKFKTVSTTKDQYDTDELLKMKDFLRTSFPAVFNSSFVEVETVNTYSLLLTIKGSNPTVLPFMLTSHMDVVPVNPDEWSRPPFLGEVVPDPETGEDCLWGRGAIDDKVGVVGILSAMDLLFSSGWTPERSFYVAFGHDEEVGGWHGARHIGQLLLERNVTLDFLIDEGLPIVQGVLKGIEDPVAMIGVTEKGFMNIKISTEGEGGHSSIPPKSQAVGRLASALTNLYNYPQPSMFGQSTENDMFRYLAPKASWPYKLLFSNTWLFGPLMSYEMSKKRESNSFLRTTTALTIVNGGIKFNVVPSSAYAIVNHRVHPAQSLDDVIAHDRAVIGDDQVKLQIIDQMEPHPISPYGPESLPYMLIAGAVKHVYPDVITSPGLTVGNTDTKYYLPLTSHVYRFIPVLTDSTTIPGIHGKNERLTTSNFKSAILFYRCLIQMADDTDSYSHLQSSRRAGEL